MNLDLYFETDPWSHAIEMVHSGELGRIATFGVQAACVPGALEETLEQWLNRLNELFGQPKTCDKLAGERAASLLLRYDGHVIGRVFIDQSADEPFSNFELAGTDALLIWKPDVCAFSTVSTPGKQRSLYQHPYPVSLSKEVHHD